MNYLNKTALKSDLIENHFINNPAVHTLTENDLTDYFSNMIKTGYMDYIESSKKYVDVIDAITKKLGTGITKAESNDLDIANGLLDRLDVAVKEISESAAKDVMALTKIQKEYDELRETYPTGWSPITDIDAFKSSIYSAAMDVERNSGRLISDYSKLLATYDYTQDYEVTDDLDDLDNRIALGANALEVIYSNKPDFEAAIGRLKAKKDVCEKAAGNVINTADFDNYKKERKDVKDEFKKVYGEMAPFAAVPTDLNQSLQNVFRTYNTELLSREHAVMVGDPNYQTVLNAYISSEIEDIYHLAPDYLSTELARYKTSFDTALLTGGSSDDMKSIIEATKSLKRLIDSVNNSASKHMKKDLQDWYRYVVMNSELDPLSEKDEFKWHMFKNEFEITNDHAVNSYAGGGLGFFSNLVDDNYFNRITEGVYENGKKLEEMIIKKHKCASSLLDRWRYGIKNTKIGVDEALLWGLYSTITDSDRDDIESEIFARWNAVTWLDNTTTLRDIKRTYGSAEALGREINADAKYWTQRKTKGYEKLDNEKLNKKAGVSYAIADKLWGGISSFLGSHNVTIPKQESDNEKEVDVDKTAFERKFHPHAQLTLEALLALYGIHLAGSAVMANLSISEILKEFGIAVTAAKFVH